jgi:hypothetical protein
MPADLEPRPWVPTVSDDRVRAVSTFIADLPVSAMHAEIDRLVAENHRIHDVESINLNPATNIMNPRAEALLSARLGSRPSLGYPGDKYEMGLEAWPPADPGTRSSPRRPASADTSHTTPMARPAGTDCTRCQHRSPQTATR